MRQAASARVMGLGFLLLLSALPAWAVQYFTLPEAQAQLFPGADRFDAVQPAVTPEQQRSINQASGLSGALPVRTTWRVSKAGQFQGWFIADHVIGKHDFIDFAVAVTPQGRIGGFDILTYRESYGGQVKSTAWRGQFAGKSGADPLAAGQDITVLSGATLSSSHLAQGVKRILLYQQQVLKP